MESKYLTKATKAQRHKGRPVPCRARHLPVQILLLLLSENGWILLAISRAGTGMFVLVGR